ncbi:GlxA family transcriptional regulator [Pseudolabrys sp. FHR47]|uniref:GlxA family transcriptional regulator n=1 Tax=Pseudolabrys sp. FHR47 TaxID=2562284 RepID=UPI0010BF270C|nr:helix-turn-helix domain-containing protein [Pseudolabrys sp. FHR47]
MAKSERPLHVSLVALPDGAVSSITGLFDVLNSFRMLSGADAALPRRPPFKVDIVAIQKEPVTLASGLPVAPSATIADVKQTDIVIVPSVVLRGGIWEIGRYPELVDWLRAQNARGAVLCSACSGVFLLAETGLFDGIEATVHFGYADAFRKTYPRVPIDPERVLVISGQRQEFVTSGASMTWHDLVLYLIARYVGAAAAQTIARFFALQWHHDGLAPYIVFDGPRHHGDAIIASAQDWLATHFAIANPVDEMIRRSGLAERTFKRRFRGATGYAPIDYVQRLRVEDAKRRLERTDESADAIAWRVGYEDPAFFRRLFKRTTGLAPGQYRRRFQIPVFAGPTPKKSVTGPRLDKPDPSRIKGRRKSNA